MYQKQIEDSINLLEKDWEIDPLIRDFTLGKIRNVSDYEIKIKDVVFHIPFLLDAKKFVLWKCYWPDCHNCCERQGRLPLTSHDLINISKKMNYIRVSDFVKKETITATWNEDGQAQSPTMTTINLKRKDDETIQDDGTHVKCRFLDEKGFCGIHPNRPGVCYLYPFSTWLQSNKGRAQVHASFQFTGDCPGFYLADTIEPAKDVLQKYSSLIYDYNMQSNRTVREGYGSACFG